MKIGVSSQLLIARDLRAVVEETTRQGFQAIEIWTEHIRRNRLDTKKLLQALRSSGLNWTVHADMRDLNLTSRNDGIRRESLRQVERAVRQAAAIEAKMITVHPGRKSSVKDRQEDLWPRLVDVLQRLSRLARIEGLTLCAENMEYNPLELVVSLADMERLYADVREPNFRMTLDLAHLYHNPQAETVATFIRRVPGLANVHLSDSSPESRHLLLGRGEVDYQAMLGILRERYDGNVILEGYTPSDGFECLPYLFARWQEAISVS